MVLSWGEVGPYPSQKEDQDMKKKEGRTQDTDKGHRPGVPDPESQLSKAGESSGWQFFAVMIIIAVGTLALILRAAGLL